MSNRNEYTLTAINDAWAAVHEATLMFVMHSKKLLLIRKKRGLGAGKINGPGGKRDLGETIQECAHREIHEELCVRVRESEKRARLRFQFIDGYSLDVHVFLTTDYTGTPTETEEAVPIWANLDSIPFDEMWEDDRLWLPWVLAGEYADGRFVFDGDTMLEYDIVYDRGR